MQNEKIFDQAVHLAAAFVQNGDIRVVDNLTRESLAMNTLADFIPVVYGVLRDARQACIDQYPDRE